MSLLRAYKLLRVHSIAPKFARVCVFELEYVCALFAALKRLLSSKIGLSQSHP